jgi:DNA-binding transcriptional LysR family regulator
MEVFVAIVDHGSLTGAARSLGRSLPTVVRTLSVLEAHLDTRLLNRTTRRIALTDEGRRYLARCRRILADVQDAESELADGNEPAGQVTVTAPVLFGQMHVVPGIAGFLARHLRARVDLLLLDKVISLVDEGVDLAVRIAHLEDSSLVARRVGHIRRVLCASPAYLERAGYPHHPRELSGRDCLRWRTLDGGRVWRFQEAGRLLSVHPQGRFASNHVAAALNACTAGLGIGSFLSYQVADAVRRGQLELLLEEFEPDPIPVSLVHTHARLIPSRVRAMADWLAVDLTARLRAG